jgi:hypothetical protein
MHMRAAVASGNDDLGNDDLDRHPAMALGGRGGPLSNTAADLNSGGAYYASSPLGVARDGPDLGLLCASGGLRWALSI